MHCVCMLHVNVYNHVHVPIFDCIVDKKTEMLKKMFV